MKLSFIVRVSVLAGMVFTASCSAPAPRVDRAGHPIRVNMKAVTFKTERCYGTVQVRPHARAAWHDLEPGEIFDGFYQIRTGLRSGAVLVMRHAGRTCTCRIGSLLTATDMRDVYDKALCPTGAVAYTRHLKEIDEVIDPRAGVQVSRDALMSYAFDKEMSESLLAQASNLSTLRTREAVGAAGAASGGAPGGGGGGSGGGCGSG